MNLLKKSLRDYDMDCYFDAAGMPVPSDEVWFIKLQRFAFVQLQKMQRIAQRMERKRPSKPNNVCYGGTVKGGTVIMGDSTPSIKLPHGPALLREHHKPGTTRMASGDTVTLPRGAKIIPMGTGTGKLNEIC